MGTYHIYILFSVCVDGAGKSSLVFPESHFLPQVDASGARSVWFCLGAKLPSSHHSQRCLLRRAKEKNEEFLKQLHAWSPGPAQTCPQTR